MKVAEVRTRVLKIRLTESSYQAMARSAGAGERTVSDWARRLLEAEVRGMGVESETMPPPVPEPEPVGVPIDTKPTQSPRDKDDDLEDLLAGMDFSIDG